MNPGGPGGSGTSALVRFGKDLSVIVEGRYDVSYLSVIPFLGADKLQIISWDPRGVNMTTPSLDCHATEGAALHEANRLHSLGSPLLPIL